MQLCSSHLGHRLQYAYGAVQHTVPVTVQQILRRHALHTEANGRKQADINGSQTDPSKLILTGHGLAN